MKKAFFLFSLLVLPVFALMIKPFLEVLEYAPSYFNGLDIGGAVEALILLIIGLLLATIAIQWHEYNRATLTLISLILSFVFIVGVYSSMAFPYISSVIPYTLYFDVGMANMLFGFYLFLFIRCIVVRRKRNAKIIEIRNVSVFPQHKIEEKRRDIQ